MLPPPTAASRAASAAMLLDLARARAAAMVVAAACCTHAAAAVLIAVAVVDTWCKDAIVARGSPVSGWPVGATVAELAACAEFAAVAMGAHSTLMVDSFARFGMCLAVE